ncbi:hypothetical protein CMUS01_16666, partial [Colletotrichum musicola]
MSIAQCHTSLRLLKLLKYAPRATRPCSPSNPATAPTLEAALDPDSIPANSGPSSASSRGLCRCIS